MANERFGELISKIPWLMLLLVALVGALPSAAQPLVTDRPDFTESAITVPRHSIQIESGVTATFEGDLRTTSGPEMLIRWGVLDQLEIRIGSPDFVFADETSGATDPVLGAKLALGSVSDVDIAVIAVTTIPAGDSRFSSSEAEPQAIVTAGTDVGTISLGSQLEGAWDSAAERLLFAATLVAGTALSENVGGFVEIAISEEVTGPMGILLHSGATFALADLVQLDLHVGLGASEVAPDFLVGAGLSLRR